MVGRGPSAPRFTLSPAVSPRCVQPRGNISAAQYGYSCAAGGPFPSSTSLRPLVARTPVRISALETHSRYMSIQSGVPRAIASSSLSSDISDDDGKAAGEAAAEAAAEVAKKEEEAAAVDEEASSFSDLGVRKLTRAFSLLLICCSLCSISLHASQWR